MFGCKWKINFSKVIWSWPCKMRLWSGNGLKGKFSLQIIFESDAQRERESAHERKKRKPRSRLQHHRRTSSSSPTIARTRLQWSRWSQLHIDRTAPFDLADWSHLRPTDLQPTDLSMILIFVVVVVVWLWCYGGCVFWLLEFAAVGWIEVSVVCGVGIWLWFVPWIGIWLWFWNFL